MNSFETRDEWVPKWNGEYFSGTVEDAARIDQDPRYRELLQEKSLEWLQAKNSDWFQRNYSGVAGSGYLLDAQGRETDMLPSQCVTGGHAQVEDEVRKLFRERYPEEAAWYKIDFSGKKAA